MAHECPECGCTCHCGGDIDDCTFAGTKYELLCTCCDCDDCGAPPGQCDCEIRCPGCEEPADWCICNEHDEDFF